MINTLDYYNKNAEAYCRSTLNADFTGAYERFLHYIPEHGSIVDVGCGSGRDLKVFASKGYQTIGIDASEQLVRIAEQYAGVPVIKADMSSWLANEPFDGIWCCASLLHLDDEGVDSFLQNLNHNLKKKGAIYISVKSGISTGYDEKGRYMHDFTEKELKKLLEEVGISIAKEWNTNDKLDRSGFYWINLVGVKND